MFLIRRNILFEVLHRSIVESGRILLRVCLLKHMHSLIFLFLPCAVFAKNVMFMDFFIEMVSVLQQSNELEIS